MAQGNFKLGIVVPYRDREDHLKVFAPYMSKYLEELDHEVYIVEQQGDGLFNRAKLCNIGYDVGRETCDYFVFHDVDLLPLEVDYSFRRTPTHLARRLDYLGYKACYPTNFGGVTLMDKISFKKVNGFSNEYWGWGGEDDDLRMRCVREGIEPGVSEGMFMSMPHPPTSHVTGTGVGTPHWQKNSDRFWAFANNPQDQYYKGEGLTTLKYTLESVTKFSDYTLVKVEV